MSKRGRGFPDGSAVKNVCKAGDVSSILGWEDPLKEEISNPLQYSCLGNPMDRGAWRTTDQRVAKIWTQLSEHVNTGNTWYNQGNHRSTSE